MAILSTNKITVVLQTEHRKAKGKTEDVSWIFTVYNGAHYEQKFPTEIPIPYCIHLCTCLSIIIITIATSLQTTQTNQNSMHEAIEHRLLPFGPESFVRLFSSSSSASGCVNELSCNRKISSVFQWS